jgi:hypothetical protein
MLVKEVLEKTGIRFLIVVLIFPPYPTPTANWSLLQESCARPSLFLLLVSETAEW